MAESGHGGHRHHGSGNERALLIAALLTGSFMLAEVAGGLLSGSLALLADAGHMLTDFASLVLAWLAIRVSRRPADWKRTYGFGRFSVLAAFVNGITLLAITAWIAVEAVRRLFDPVEVLGAPMLAIAVAGLVVNIVAFWVLTRGQHDNLNLRAAALHVLGDLLGSIAAIVAAGVILWTGWSPIDPILSVVVALLILRSALVVVREAGHILLEAAPEGFDPRRVSSTLAERVDGVQRVHHLHAWTITEDRPMATMEVEIAATADRDATRSEIKRILKDEFGVGHATVEVTRGP